MGNVSELGFRVAVEMDWPEIFTLFGRVTATADTYPYPPDLPETEARSIWLAEKNTVFVATLGSEVVGTAYFRPNMAGFGDHICNAGWMIDPSHQGKGIGRRFAEYVISRAGEAGFRGMQFNAVVATNTSAIGLWESLGFEIVGTVPDAFRHSTFGLTPVHIMYREL